MSLRIAQWETQYNVYTELRSASQRSLAHIATTPQMLRTIHQWDLQIASQGKKSIHSPSPFIKFKAAQWDASFSFNGLRRGDSFLPLATSKKMDRLIRLLEEHTGVAQWERIR